MQFRFFYFNQSILNIKNRSELPAVSQAVSERRLSGLSDAVVFDDIVHILITSAGEIDED